MSDLERNVRVSFKLSQEAAIKLREIALTKRELLCNLGVLAVQLGNESQICISSSLSFENAARIENNRSGTAKKREAAKEKRNLKDASKIPKAGNNVKKLLNVDRAVRPVDQSLARVTADSVMISDSLAPKDTVNKASFMNKISSQENGRRAHKVPSLSKGPSKNVSDSCTSIVKGNAGDDEITVKHIPYNGVIKFNPKDAQEAEGYRSALYEKQLSKKSTRELKTLGKNSKDDSHISNEIQDDSTVRSVNIHSVSDNAKKYAKDMTASQESSRKTSPKVQSQEMVNKPKTFTQDGSSIDSDSQKCDKTDMKMDCATLNEPDAIDMTESYDCVNGNGNDIPTFPGHGISFAQHLINLSKQYRSEHEGTPTGLANEKFFEPSTIVRNDHVLRSFTATNDKQEDFMGFSEQNALLFDGSYSKTAVKSAEELSKEQSEASPTNLDSMSEASADSLFEEARLGSVDELSLSPSSNENAPVSNENNAKVPSPASSENKQLDFKLVQVKQEKQKKKIRYQRHLKGHSGIICKLCMHPVSKSYSCYKLAQAPKEIWHLFEDGSNCVRVCRRCLPYKSPKNSDKNTQKRLHKTIENLLK